jgi:hypothetical protein
MVEVIYDNCGALNYSAVIQLNLHDVQPMFTAPPSLELAED